METIEQRRTRQREWKKIKRRTDPDWLEKERSRRRKYGKNRTRNKIKEAEYSKTYRSKPENILKEKARAMVRQAIKKEEILVPENCEECNKKPKQFKDKRRTLRADHYAGYDKPLIVRFICVECDGKQLRSKKKLV